MMLTAGNQENMKRRFRFKVYEMCICASIPGIITEALMSDSSASKQAFLIY